MVHILRRQDQRKRAIADVEFEGEEFGAGVSFFVGNLPTGKGPGLHRHPYPETCIVRAGRVALTVSDETVVGEAGDIVVIDAGTPHSFKALDGDETLQMLCIHVTDRFVIEWLE